MSAPEDTTTATQGAQQLRASRLKLWHLCVLGIAYQGLALAIYLNLGFIETQVGPIAPLVFLGISIAMVPTAISFAVMTNRMPSSGSAFWWASRTISARFGVWVGWILASLYVFSVCLQPPIFGLFFNSLLEFIGISATWWTAVIGGLAATAFVGYTTLKDIRISAKVTFALLTFEIAFVAFLSIFIVIKQGAAGHLTAAPFSLSSNTGGHTGLLLALIFGVLSVSGFDVVAPLAAEARSPKRFVPIAVVVSLLGAGVYMALVSYGYVEAVPVSTFVGKFSASGQITPIYPLAGRYIGNFKLLVSVTGMTAVLACFGSISQAATRVIFTLGQQGHGPRAFGRLHPAYRTPWNAEKFVLGIAIVVPIAMILWLDRSPLSAYGWLGSLVVFFILVTYSLVNIINIVYHLRNRDQMNWVTNLAVPILGLAVDAYVLYYASFKSLLENGSFRFGTSIVIVSLVWAVLGIGWAVSKRKLPSRDELAAGDFEDVPAEGAP
jgi:amino acid transporter